ncbi:cupin domain-containing protein [Nocardia spumae]|uniref:cupin domain-containing protein n=1 Tax=Nocardia spumae TaxID=2887190 RepID=UPI001D15012E|nr:cupin domain-containing protein [Nocardia spumae]
MPATLTFRNGHQVTHLTDGIDEHGPYLLLRHHLPVPGRQAGPHWHPDIAEQWTVRRGKLEFRVGGRTVVAREGDTLAAPARTVHAFASVAPETVIDHEIRPPARHWEMFRFWHALDAAGRTTHSGIPRNPLALALLWDYQDGYLAGVPALPQRALLGPLAALGRRLGYERRLLRKQLSSPGV